MRYDKITVRLLDKFGFLIIDQECETVKEAKERAKYYLSEAYAHNAETTHENWQTDKAEIECDGDIVYEFFYKKPVDKKTT